MVDIDTLYELIRSGDRNAIDKALLPNIDYNQLNKLETPLLHIACAVEDPISVEKILRYGGNPNSGGPNRIAPLLCILQSPPIVQCPELDNFTKIVDLLLEAGADVNITGFDGRTPLMTAYHSIYIEKFIKPDAEINAQDKKGNTPLHHMIDQHSYCKDAVPKFDDIGYEHAQDLIKCMDLLIKAGADMDLANENGDTPMSLAMQSQNKPLQELFMNAKDEIQNKAAKAFHENARKEETAQRNAAMKRALPNRKIGLPKRRR